MRRTLIVAYGFTAYVLSLASFLYLIGFLANAGVPKSIDSGEPVPYSNALIVNSLLLGAFALQHSGMARRGFKRALARLTPPSMERSSFALATCAALALLYWQWRPLPYPIWSFESEGTRAAMWLLFAAGWVIVGLSTAMIGHLDMFGVRETLAAFQGREYAQPGFRTPGFYRFVRHPIQAGVLLALWATPQMTAGRLLFAGLCTVYVLFAVKRLEEPDLLREMGEDYRKYMRDVPGFIPRLTRRARQQPGS